MKQKRKHIVICMMLCVIAPLALGLASCAPGRSLTTREVSSIPLSAGFTLIRYGCSYSTDVETVALLDKEGDPYVFEIYAPPSFYTVTRNVPAAEALQAAEQFVQCNRYYQQRRISEIVGPAGEAIGYEVKPLYSRLNYSSADVFDVVYSVRDGVVVAYIHLKPEVKEREPLLLRDLKRLK